MPFLLIARFWGRRPRYFVEDNQPSRRLVLPEPETTAGNRPRVYKSSWNPRPLQGNRPPCLQKFLQESSRRLVLPEPETTAGNQPRVYKSSWNPRPLQGNPPCLQKFLQETSRVATGPQRWSSADVVGGEKYRKVWVCSCSTSKKEKLNQTP